MQKSKSHSNGTGTIESKSGSRMHYCLASVVSLALLTTAPTFSNAQELPSGPMTIVVGYSAGGTTDILARYFASGLAESLGQQVTVQNMPGASGMIAAEAVTRAKADGLTLLFAASNEAALNKALFQEMSYDPFEDLASISLVGTSPLILVANPNTPYSSLDVLIEKAKADPGVAFGSVGLGTPNHVAGELLGQMAEIELIHAPYPGAGPLVPAILGEHVPLAFLAFFSAIPLVQEGQLVPLGLTSAERFPTFPELPTISEFGFDGFNIGQWYAVYAPSGTPEDVIELLNTEIVRIVNDEVMQERMLSSGVVPVGSSPDELMNHAMSQLENYSSALDAAGIEPQ